MSTSTPLTPDGEGAFDREGGEVAVSVAIAEVTVVAIPAARGGVRPTACGIAIALAWAANATNTSIPRYASIWGSCPVQICRWLSSAYAWWWQANSNQGGP
jgi:hypothetical protein